MPFCRFRCALAHICFKVKGAKFVSENPSNLELQKTTNRTWVYILQENINQLMTSAQTTEGKKSMVNSTHSKNRQAHIALGMFWQ